jgi:hypothetical protein
MKNIYNLIWDDNDLIIRTRGSNSINPLIRGINIYSILGEIIFQYTNDVGIEELRINLSSYQNGIYFIKINDENIIKIIKY